MGIFDKIKRVFQRSASMRSDAASMQSDAAAMEFPSQQLPTSPQPSSPISIEKDSLQLGIAAGFTGRSLRTIEDSLTRIETQMVTKDWMSLEIKTDLDKKLDIIQGSLDSITRSASGLPYDVRAGIVSEIDRIKEAIQPTSRMLKIIEIVRETKEISYDDLAARLGIEVSSLRGVLSLMQKRISLIERFEKDNRGWVRYKEPIESMQSDANRKSITDLD